MLTTRGFHSPCYITMMSTTAVGTGPGPGAAGATDLWSRVLTPPATPTTPTPSSPFSTPTLANDTTGRPGITKAEERPLERLWERPCLERTSKCSSRIDGDDTLEHCALELSSQQHSAGTLERTSERPSEHFTESVITGAPGWSLRSRRHRLSTLPAKRLFTPDIKKMLKGWLVRRRDNPYPSRAEKEALGNRTGLTYMQVCNWFANWRRKLRDCGRPEGVDDESGGGGGGGGGASTASWAHLIRRYNAQVAAPNSSTAQEHFSISSCDSIWTADDDERDEDELRSASGTGCRSLGAQQNAYVSSTTTDLEVRTDVTKIFSSDHPSLPDRKRKLSASDDGSGASLTALASPSDRTRSRRQSASGLSSGSGTASGSALLLSKWLESAARYQPSAACSARGAAPAACSARGAAPAACSDRGAAPAAGLSQKPPAGWGAASAAVEHTLEGRHRKELDAAEALAFLSSLHFR